MPKLSEIIVGLLVFLVIFFVIQIIANSVAGILCVYKLRQQTGMYPLNAWRCDPSMGWAERAYREQLEREYWDVISRIR